MMREVEYVLARTCILKFIHQKHSQVCVYVWGVCCMHVCMLSGRERVVPERDESAEVNTN